MAAAPEGPALIAAVRSVDPVLTARCLTEPGTAPAPDAVRATQAALLADLRDPRVHLRELIAAGEALGRLGDRASRPSRWMATGSCCRPWWTSRRGS